MCACFVRHVAHDIRERVDEPVATSMSTISWAALLIQCCQLMDGDVHRFPSPSSHDYTSETATKNVCCDFERHANSSYLFSVRQKWVRSVLCSDVFATSDDCEVSWDSVAGVLKLSFDRFPRCCTLLLAVSIPVCRSAASSLRLGWRASAVWVSSLSRTSLWDKTN